MRSFKSICTKEIRKIKGPYIVWQKNFHDTIIHNKNQLEKIRHYIKINPEIWNRNRNNVYFNHIPAPIFNQSSMDKSSARVFSDKPAFNKRFFPQSTD